MSQWTSETGILRKNKPKENHEELLVFGYACKLFRDDEKALFIDQGKHLIPWMGDDKLKIDRYDCRGALSDLKRFEASREGYDAMRWLGLSESDRKLEELCDKERYYSLLINEEEEEMYKEEELKRQKTNAVQYTYDVPPPPKEEGPAAPEEEEEEYVPLPSLDVPIDINIPKTVKEYARIEKTAKFVRAQGPQMEILIKAKQGDNPQFSFLNQGDPLYKFYRHVLLAFKSGRYQGQLDNTEEKQEDQPEESGHYLHPSLIASKSQPEPVTAPVPYKPSANCAYSQLVNRIQGNAAPDQVAPPPPPQDTPQMTYEQQQYYQYYYTAQYYEYYKQMAQNQGQFAPPPDFQLDPNTQAYFQQLAYNQYMQHQQQQSQNPYAQIVSNVNKEGNQYTANVPSLPEPKEIKTVTRVTVPEEPRPKEGVVSLKKPLLSLAQYGSDDSEEEEEVAEAATPPKPDVKVVYMMPTGETQIVIDKMAAYVSKNGEQFEEIVKAKGDPRFEFLNSSHEYNKYYRDKIRELKVVKTPPKEEKKKIIAPVSFSIKKPKEEPTKEIKSALPVEESDEEGVVSVEGVVEAEPPPEPEEPAPPSDPDDPILEMIDLTFDVEERKDAKRAEDKIKDKLAAAAREKMASASRDKALQLERKKKAAAFLKLKSKENVIPETTASVDEPSRRNSSDVEIVSTETPKVKSHHSRRDDNSDEEHKKKKKSGKKKKHKRERSKSSSKKSKKKRRRSSSCSSRSS